MTQGSSHSIDLAPWWQHRPDLHIYLFYLFPMAVACPYNAPAPLGFAFCVWQKPALASACSRCFTLLPPLNSPQMMCQFHMTMCSIWTAFLLQHVINWGFCVCSCQNRIIHSSVRLRCEPDEYCLTYNISAWSTTEFPLHLAVDCVSGVHCLHAILSICGFPRDRCSVFKTFRSRKFMKLWSYFILS